MSHRFDAAIIGGGPAGCSAAITLAQSGAKVLLAEAKAYPHDKLCGEFLSPECPIYLDQLGMGATLQAQGAAAIEWVRISATNGAAWQSRLPGTAWGLSRKLLDAALGRQAQALGVTLWEGTQVARISGNLERGFELETRSGTQACSVQASLVVGAYGKRASLDRLLKRRFLQIDQPYMALKSHFQGPPLGQAIELHAFPGGYCGLSQIEGGLHNVCLLARQPVFKRVSGGPPDPIACFVAWMRGQNPRLEAWFERAERSPEDWLSIAQVPFVKKRPLVNDILMVGDAAGLIAPLAGDGIAMALQGGRLAGQLGSRYLSGHMSPAALRQAYPAAWRRAFAARLRLGRWLQALMLRPLLLAAGLGTFTALPGLGSYFVRRTRGLGQDEGRTVVGLIRSRS
jgi:flavin-dependent dehydrogenase